MLNILDFIKRNEIWLGSFNEIDRLAVYGPINGLYESGRYWLKEHSIVSDCVNKITSRRSRSFDIKQFLTPARALSNIMHRKRVPN